MKWSLVSLLMVLVTVLTVAIPNEIDAILYQWHIGMWQHFPGFLAGVVWMICAVTLMTLVGRGVHVSQPMFQWNKKPKTEQNNNKIYSLEDLKAFATKMLQTRLNSRYLAKFDEAKDKRKYCETLVDEVTKASPPKPS